MDASPPPNARILTSNVQQWTQSIAFELPGPEDQALAEVAERLEQRGWITDTVDRSGTPQRLRCSSRDGRTMTVLAHGTLAGSTAVLLTIYQPHDAR